MAEGDEEQDSQQDRRRHPRRKLPEIYVEIQDGIHLISARVVDYSGGGIGIRCPRPLSVNDSVNVLVKKEPAPDSPFEAMYEGEVCWTRKKLEADHFRSGIQINIPRDHLDL